MDGVRHKAHGWTRGHAIAGGGGGEDEGEAGVVGRSSSTPASTAAQHEISHGHQWDFWWWTMCIVYSKVSVSYLAGEAWLAT